MNDSDRLQALVETIGEHNRPPVEQWNPSHVGSIDITVRRNGSWMHEGAEIKRQALVRLFASILRVEDGKHYLVTPVEKLEIQVDDAPFVAVAMDIFERGSENQVIAFRTNLDDDVIVNTEHAISVTYSPQGEPAPYVTVRNGLQALLGRTVWLELAEHAIERDGVACVLSNGMYFALTD